MNELTLFAGPGEPKGDARIMTRLDAIIADAIILLKSNELPGGYYGAFSGGKDSVIIKELARMAAVKVVWHYHNTTIDPPEALQFIRQYHPDVIWDKPAVGNFFRYAIERGYPTRKSRWCCDVYKKGKLNGPTILGIRAEESARRKMRWTRCVMVDHMTGHPVVLPIRLWTHNDVWSFIRAKKLPYCSLYDEGFKRIGCVGCPLAISSRRERDRQWRRWPKYKVKWQKLFDDIWMLRAGTTTRSGREWMGSALFDSASELFAWWDDGQGNITHWREAHGLRIKDGSPHVDTFAGMEGHFP